MSVKLTLPLPPLTYDRRYEMLRNREIERAINQKISANELNAYGGTPFIAVTGSNPVFTIPVGSTPIKLPFNTTLKDTDSDVVHNPVDYTLSNPFAMDCIFFVNLRHAAAPGGTYDFTIQAFDNGVPAAPPLTQTLNNNQTQDIRISRFVVGLPAGSVLDLRAFHNRTGSVDFNMSISQWGIIRMSPFPALVQP